MDPKSKVFFLLTLAMANAGLIVLPPKVLEGPSSKTTLVGPDGSVISAFSPGGKILLDDNQGPVLQGAPEVVAIAGVPQPVPVTETQVVAEVPVDTEDKIDLETVSVDPISTPAVVLKSAPAKLVESDKGTETATKVKASSAAPIPVAKGGESSEIVENKTEISTGQSEPITPADVPLSKGHAAVEIKTAGSPAVLSFIPDSPLFVPEYSAFEGHFIPDDFEHAFNDGSYNHAVFDW